MQDKNSQTNEITGMHDNRANHLINEVSPYLLQHAWNPVEWYPWSDEAFVKAAALDRPVFLSIGYATCHWCHVMERESFEDEEIASLLNAHFIAVKVDREERPDIDQVYMTASQFLNRAGGWPLTIIMTPDKKPFFAATYLPREGRFGMPGLVDILPAIANIWTGDRSRLLETAERVTAFLAKRSEKGKGRVPQKTALTAGFEDLLIQFDRTHGGFGNAPKFPLCHNLMFLLRYFVTSRDEKVLQMVEKTLLSMSLSGIYDHLGYGFHRYSTDNRWLVPHFEKMLYDQAMAVMAYTEAFQVTGNPEYSRIASECLSYVEHNLTSREGGFYSAQDADSEGEEGSYYLWTRQEIERVLPSGDAGLFSRIFRVTTPGNYLDPASGERTGKNILHMTIPSEAQAHTAGISAYDLERSLQRSRARLLEARQERFPPLIDDKVLADWNGLMIAAYAKAGRAFGEERYLAAAERAARFVLTRMLSKSGTLFHRFRADRAGIQGQAPDYAFLIFGLIELYQATFDPGFLAAALDLQKIFHQNFWDSRSGGYFTTSEGQTDLIARRKDLFDGAIPSPNSVAFHNLVRLSLLTGDPAHNAIASKLSRIYTLPFTRSPGAYTFFLMGLATLYGPTQELVIVGHRGDTCTENLIGVTDRMYLPFTVTLFKGGGGSTLTDRIAPFTASMVPVPGKGVAYVCSGHSCSLPVHEAGELEAALSGYGIKR